MDELASTARILIETHAGWAGPVIGILCFAESLAVVGLFVPATAILLMIGGLVGSGVLDPATVLFWAVAGCVLGDALSYIIGRAIGPRVYHRWPLNRHRQLVVRTRLYSRRYGFWAILIGRFVGPIRPIAPLVAGVVQMPQRPFQIANVLSAIIWAPLMLAPGYLVARGFLAVDLINDGQWMVALSIFGLIGLGVPALIAYWLNSYSASRRERRKAV